MDDNCFFSEYDFIGGWREITTNPQASYGGETDIY